MIIIEITMQSQWYEVEEKDTSKDRETDWRSNKHTNSQIYVYNEKNLQGDQNMDLYNQPSDLMQGIHRKEVVPVP
jgi:hypothetical protein